MDIKVPSRICWTNLQCCSPVCQYTESTSTASVHCSVPKPHMIPNFRMSRDAFHIIIKCMLTWAPTRSHPSASSWMMSQLQLIYKTLTTLTYNHTHTQTIQTIILHTRTRKDINLRPKDGRPQFLNFKLAISSIGLFNELENVTRERTIDRFHSILRIDWTNCEAIAYFFCRWRLLLRCNFWNCLQKPSPYIYEAASYQPNKHFQANEIDNWQSHVRCMYMKMVCAAKMMEGKPSESDTENTFIIISVESQWRPVMWMVTPSVNKKLIIVWSAASAASAWYGECGRISWLKPVRVGAGHVLSEPIRYHHRKDADAT